jgi:hypothetical protein
MNNKHKTLLQNLYKMAKNHAELNQRLSNDLSRSDILRSKSEGSLDAYEFVLQMINHSDTIGNVDYDKVYRKRTLLPTFLK